MKKILFILKLLEIRLRFVAILVVTALVVGYWDNIQNHIERWQRSRMTSAEKKHDHAGAVEGQYEYYCPMHPFVIREQPGNCPICGMTLVKREKGAPAELPAGTLNRVQISPERVMQAGIQVEPTLYRQLARSIQSYGVVEADETRTFRIVARFPGRVEELTINAVGQVVAKGDSVARIYSPKFLAAAQEYTQALQAAKSRSTDAQASPDEKKRATQLADSAKKRLLLAGFTEEQTAEIARKGGAEKTVTLHSPLSGIVMEKNVMLGDMVEEQTTLYTIADLSKLWVQAMAPEADVDLVKVGMPVRVTSVARPGEIFYGTVDFVYPTINTESRSGKVRVLVDNKQGKLKPGMYVDTTIYAPIAKYEEVAPDKAGKGKEAKVSARGAVHLPTLTQEDADKYLATLKPGQEYYQCPMDIEVLSDKPGECPKCGMALGKQTASGAEPGKKQEAALQTASSPDQGSTEQWAEGYACPMHLDRLVAKGGVCQVDDCGMQMKKWRVERVLAVPESAVIDTGNRYVVYVETMPGVFDAREVRLGRRSGAYYPVLSGLSLGQRIATKGSFLIDAEARLNPATTVAPKASETPAAQQHAM